MHANSNRRARSVVVPSLGLQAADRSPEGLSRKGSKARNRCTTNKRCEGATDRRRGTSRTLDAEKKEEEGERRRERGEERDGAAADVYVDLDNTDISHTRFDQGGQDSTGSLVQTSRRDLARQGGHVLAMPSIAVRHSENWTSD